MLIDINSIKPDKNQPRKIFSKDHIDGLAISLSQEGMINAIEVDENSKIITGECRWRAAKQLGWKEVPITVNNAPYDEYQRLRHQMAENVHQSGSTYDTMMNPIDTAKGYARLISLKVGKDYSPGELSHDETYGLIKPIASEIGVNYETIWDHLKLLNQPEFVQKDIQEGRPRTYYREAERAPEEVQNQIKEKIAGGEYQSRSEISQDVAVIKRVPDLAQAQLERKRDTESAHTNRILNRIAELGLALEAQPLELVDLREKGMISQQLKWLVGKIEEYLS